MRAATVRMLACAIVCSRRVVFGVATCPTDVVFDLIQHDAAINHTIARNMNISIRSVTNSATLKQAAASWRRADIVVDAILGTGFRAKLEA